MSTPWGAPVTRGRTDAVALGDKAIVNPMIARMVQPDSLRLNIVVLLGM